MALAAYTIEARNTDGTLLTGLTPTVSSFKKESDNSNLTGVTLTFIETVPGLYKFYYDPIINGEAFLQVDLGASTASANRYVNMFLTIDNTVNILASVIDGTLSLKQSLKAISAVLFGNAVGTSNDVQYKAQDGTTTIITGASFTNNGSRTITKGSL
jgi:hypothetical protein